MGMARTFCGKYSSAEDSDARSGGHGGLKESELAGKFRWVVLERAPGLDRRADNCRWSER